MFHETARDAVSVPIRADLATVIRAQLPAADWASKYTNSLSLTRSLRSAGCPADLCCRAFHHTSVQQLLLGTDHGAARELLRALYRLHAWEDGVTDDDVVQVEEESTAQLNPVLPGDVLQLLGTLERVSDNLDALFLRLRESPARFSTSSSLSLAGADPSASHDSSAAPVARKKGSGD